MGGTRRQWLWVEQEGFRSSCSSAITPRGKDSITRHDARSIMPNILEGRALRRHNDIGEQRILGVNVGASLDRCDDRHANVGYVFQNLAAFVVNLAPNARI